MCHGRNQWDCDPPGHALLVLLAHFTVDITRVAGRNGSSPDITLRLRRWALESEWRGGSVLEYQRGAGLGCRAGGGSTRPGGLGRDAQSLPKKDAHHTFSQFCQRPIPSSGTVNRLIKSPIFKPLIKECTPQPHRLSQKTP